MSLEDDILAPNRSLMKFFPQGPSPSGQSPKKIYWRNGELTAEVVKQDKQSKDLEKDLVEVQKRIEDVEKKTEFPNVSSHDIEHAKEAIQQARLIFKKIAADSELGNKFAELSKKIVQSVEKETSQKTDQTRLQAVYSLADGDAFLLCTYTGDNEAEGILNLRISDNSFVKLKGLHIKLKKPEPFDEGSWISIGEPASLFVLKEEFEEKLFPKWYGKSADRQNLVKEAGEMFKNHACSSLRERAVLQGKTGQGKPSSKTGRLAIEMDASGEFYAVKRTEVARGGSKKVYSEVVFPIEGEEKKLARSKLKKNGQGIEQQKKMQRELDLNAIFLREKVPHILPATPIFSENEENIRMGADFMEGGDWFEIVAKGGDLKDITPEVFLVRLEALVHVAETLKVVHELDFVHGDVKAKNVLYNKARGESHLTDFDGTVKKGDIVLAMTYAPPEKLPPEIETKDNESLKKEEEDSVLVGSSGTGAQVVVEEKEPSVHDEEGVIVVGSSGSGAQVVAESPKQDESVKKASIGPDMTASTKDDSWGYGLMMYAFLHGAQAQLDIDMTHFARGKKTVMAAVEKIRGQLSKTDEADILIAKLLSDDPQVRPEMDEVIGKLRKIIAAEADILIAKLLSDDPKVRPEMDEVIGKLRKIIAACKKHK